MTAITQRIAGCVAVGAIGFLVESLPSQDLHDRFWYLFVAPVMLAMMVGGVALLMLGWSHLPRQDEGAKGSHSN